MARKEQRETMSRHSKVISSIDYPIKKDKYYRDVRRGTSRWPSTQTVYERLGSVAATPRHSPSPLMHIPLSARYPQEKREYIRE